MLITFGSTYLERNGKKQKCSKINEKNIQQKGNLCYNIINLLSFNPLVEVSRPISFYNFH